jgi:Common central domain of tyrosinase/Polyphenol oxidase middle domain
MNDLYYDRRQFLKQSGMASAMLLLDHTVFGGDLGMATPHQFNPNTMTRKDIDTLTEAELTDLRNGVSVMKSRPSSSPTSWIYQANIHGDPTGGGTSPGWNSCQHGTFFFLAWHRMYIYWLERILRAASGNQNLTLPYWNYSKNEAARALPAPFRTPTTGNPLFVANRASGINAGAKLAPSAVSVSGALNRTQFTGPTGTANHFGGQRVAQPRHQIRPHGHLENTPHDVVHDSIGGLMQNPNTAPRDPIFWLHHANIDRLWNHWLGMGGGRVNPISSTAWRSPTFIFFDESDRLLRMSVCEILDSAAQLKYRYDTDIQPLGGTCPMPGGPQLESPMIKPSQKVLAARRGTVVLGDQPVTVNIGLGAEAKSTLNAMRAGDKTLNISVDGLTVSRHPGVYWEVYLNLPASQANDPDIENGHYVGNLSFFGRAPHGGHTAPTGADNQPFDITEVVQNLRAKNLWNEDRLSVTFVARGLDSPEGKRLKPRVLDRPRFARISLVVE